MRPYACGFRRSGSPVSASLTWPNSNQIIFSEVIEKFAREDDVARIGDLDAATVYYVPPQIHRDVFAAVHHFDEPGWYVGIVTATTTGGEYYKAIFPFEVGYTGIGYWPIFALAIVLMLLLLWYDKKRTDALASEAAN